MSFSFGNSSRINTNTNAEIIQNSLRKFQLDISKRELRLSTGKSINNAADNVADYSTSRKLNATNSSLKSMLSAIADAKNVTYISMDALANISDLLETIKNSTSQAALGGLGTDEKVSLARAAFRMAEQIQTTIESTVFGGYALLNGSFSANYFISSDADNNLLSLELDLSTSNSEFNVNSNDFNINALNTGIFAGITDLDLRELQNVSENNLGIFSDENIANTMTKIADAIDNVNKVASYIGGFSNRLLAQEDILNQRIVNISSAISRIEDADIAREQMELVKSQFLAQSSLFSLSQANVSPREFLRLLE